jgi:AraC-like DNA-binding protein
MGMLGNSLSSMTGRIRGLVGPATHGKAGRRPFFSRLVGSYALIVIITTVISSFSSFLFFQRRYKAELDRIHSSLIKEAEQEIEKSIVDVSGTIYMECATQLIKSYSFFGDKDRAGGNYAKLYASWQYLIDLAARNYNRIEAVHIYYRDADLVLSSEFGLQFQGSPPYRARGRNWLAALESSGKGSVWLSGIEPSEAAFGAKMPKLTSVRSFPILSNPDTCTAIIAIDFRPETLRSSISRFLPSAGGASYLVGSDQALVASSIQKPEYSPELRAAIGDISSSLREGSSGRVTAIRGVKSLVTTLKVGNSDWTLAYVTPLSSLYRSSDRMYLVLLVICPAVIVLGLGLALSFGSSLYDPLDKLTARARGLFGLSLPPPENSNSECSVLDYAIEGLSSRMNELDATLARNRPVIKHEFLLRLAEGDSPDDGAYRETLHMLGAEAMETAGLGAWLSLSSLDALLRGDGRADFSAYRVAKYRLADVLEESGKFALLAAAMPGQNIAIIAQEKMENGLGSLIESLLASWPEELRSRWALFCGPLSEAPSGLAASLSEAKSLADYAFFFPELHVFDRQCQLLKREERSPALPRQLLASLPDTLRLGSPEKTDGLLAVIVEYCRSSDSSAVCLRRDLTRVSSAFTDYAQQIAPDRDPVGPGFLSSLETAPDIYAYVSVLSELYARLCEERGERRDERKAATVDTVKRYVFANLADDLSLARVGEEVGLSPGYLSRIFKEATGASFVAYVSETRIVEAERLLSLSEGNVQDIARRVGFNTPAYFIRQFKTKHGITPYDYQRLHRAGKVGSRS